ncbi:MAG: ribonuclease III [Rhizobacter sp.]|nr:ribonuclease III [Rhizobacter sp.]
MIRSLFRRVTASPEDRRIAAWVHRAFGIRPTDLALYRQALRHSSAVPDDRPDLPNNERLEFLGDAILDAVVGSMLFEAYPREGEGFLTRMRSRLVSRQQLNELAARVEIHRVMESNVTRGHETSVPGNALEAVFGAIYLDRGFMRTRKAIMRLITSQYKLSELEKDDRDSKSRLLEWGQKQKRKVEFVVTEETARGGKAKVYVAEVLVDGKRRGTGRGSSKKKAEQDAADAAYKGLGERRGTARRRGRQGPRPTGAAAKPPATDA